MCVVFLEKNYPSDSIALSRNNEEDPFHMRFVSILKNTFGIFLNKASLKVLCG